MPFWKVVRFFSEKGVSECETKCLIPWALPIFVNLFTVVVRV